MNLMYGVILILGLLASPFVLRVAQNQHQKTKERLRLIFAGILLVEILVGFLNWESFEPTGRSGFELAFKYPSSLLNLFFVISIVQIVLTTRKRFLSLAVILNFVNTIVLFAAMARIQQISTIPTVNLASIATTFAALTNNVIGLTLINKDRNLLKKFLWR